jgi:hypothetical protein
MFPAVHEKVSRVASFRILKMSSNERLASHPGRQLTPAHDQVTLDKYPRGCGQALIKLCLRLFLDTV